MMMHLAEISKDEESIMDEFDTTGFYTSTQKTGVNELLAEFGDDEEESSSTTLETTVISREPGTLDEAKLWLAEKEKRLKQFEQEHIKLVKQVSELENNATGKDDQINVL